MSILSEGPPQQDFTIVCGWHEMDTYYVRSHDAQTATFKAQCRAWKASLDAGAPGMGDVAIENVAVVAVFLGKRENLYPFPVEP